MGCLTMPKGIPNKRYTPEFRKQVVETMQEEKLRYHEAARQFEINDYKRVAAWEQIYPKLRQSHSLEILLLIAQLPVQPSTII